MKRTIVRFSILAILALGSTLVGAEAAHAQVAKGAPGRRALKRRASQKSQYKHYAKLVTALGGRVDTTPGERTVVGLRGIDPDGQVHGEAKRVFRSYTDTYVVLWIDDKGKPRVEHFHGSTTPGQDKTRYDGTPDADKDGTKDIAHLAPGVMKYKSRTYKGLSAFGNGKRVPCYRDTNHDGRIDVTEKRASAERGDTASGILFHRGTKTRPSSVGCQTMKPEVFDAFERALGGDKAWTYVLVDVREKLRPLAATP